MTGEDTEVWSATMEHFVEDLSESDIEDVEERTNTLIETPPEWYAA